MAVVEPRNQRYEADPQLPLNDPLSEFAPERTPRRERLRQLEPPPRERLIEFEPDWRVPGESDRLTERAFASAPSVSHAVPPRAPKRRWFSGALMLGVGLVAGFAGGVAVVTEFGDDQIESVRSLMSNRVDADIPSTEGQPPPPPVADRPADDPIVPTAPATTPIVPATNDPQREANVARPEPAPLIAGQRASGGRVETSPVTTVTGLYVQSSPAGADVYLDERLASTTPFQLSDIAPGRHTIRIDMQGYRPWSAPVSIERRALTKISAVLER